MSAGFTFQGQLKRDGAPLNDTVDMEATLWTVAVGGTQVGATLRFDGLGGNRAPLVVTHGLFTVELDFGADAFSGDARFLQIAVRYPHDPTDLGPFELLEPRQAVTPSPVAGFCTRPWESDSANVFYLRGKVGVGTTAPTAPLDVRNPATMDDASAIVGEMTSSVPGISSAGVRGVNRGTGALGVGVYGSHAGDGYGVLGTSVGGVGVYGVSTQEGTAETYGVYGKSASQGGSGVFGINSADYGRGVYGQTNGWNGNGVYGYASPTANNSNAVYGQTDSSFGRAVSGRATADSVSAIGIYGEAPPNGHAGYFHGKFYVGGLVSLGKIIDTPIYRLDLPNQADETGRARANRWDTYSSIRWKENVTPIAGALRKVLDLTGVEFDWKPEFGSAHDVGFVAEDVGKVLPEIVSWEDDRKHARGLAYDRITALLVQAIKEQQQHIDALTAECKKRLESVRNERKAEIESLRTEKDAQIDELKLRLARLEKAMGNASQQP